MQLTAFSLLSFAAMTVQAAAVMATPDAPMKGYNVFVPEWEFEVAPGETVVLNGTIEEVRNQLLEINPDYGVSSALNVTDPQQAMQLYQESTHRGNIFEGSTVYCHGFVLGNRYLIWLALLYLNDVKGNPVNSAGPGNCGRVSCGYGAAVWWCNDDTTPKKLNSFKDIADGAAHGLNSCGDWDAEKSVSAQAFHKDNWNVIVGGADC